MADWQNAGFAIYVHWPFCQAKCPYCDFNSYVSADVDTQKWRAAFLSEIKRYAEETGPRLLNSVFFGGGTPSLMPPDLVGDVLSAIKGAWPCANDLEVTLEANPSSVEIGKFRAFHDAGVTRISIGLQSLRGDHLRALGRGHTVREGEKACEIAQTVFDRVSGDLIYARQHQTIDDWRSELRHAVSLGTQHLSLYQLTIEEGTVFGDRFKRGRLKGLPDDDLAADFWDVTQEICEQAGKPLYEVSNHAAPGDESRHNLIYWRCGDYLGIGPGAHGRLTLKDHRYAIEAAILPKAWLDRVGNLGSGEHRRVVLPREEQAAEYVMMGLRLSEGIDLTRARTIYSNAINAAEVDNLVGQNLVWRRGDRVGCTGKGMPVLNSITRAVLA